MTTCNIIGRATVLSTLVLGISTIGWAGGSNAVTGSVSYKGESPKVVERIINKNPEICGHEPRMFTPVRVDENGALSGVVIYLDSAEIATEWQHPSEGYQLIQKGCSFSPYLMIFPKDKRARLTIVNDDPTLHNVRIFQLVGRVQHTLLNLSQAEGLPPKQKPLHLKPTSNVIGIRCDIHEFMEGWMFAANNPMCTINNDDGTFSLDNLPEGEHVISAWHPYLGVQSRTVTIKDGNTPDIHFEFSPEAPSRRR